MTARDEAIEAMVTKVYGGYRFAPTLCGDLLDAIPPGVLARLAIEQGALEVDHERYIIRRGRSEMLSLYRVVEL